MKNSNYSAQDFAFVAKSIRMCKLCQEERVAMEMAAVLVPVYRNELSVSEQISLRQCKRILHRHPVILIAPETLDIENHELTGFSVERFPACFFDGIAGYNRLMLSEEFYQRFERYQYILICQLDAFVFSDRLQEFCGMGYDYMGAPWFSGRRHIAGLERRYLYVGNGGFSLRKVSAFLGILEKESVTDVSEPEDLFWAKHKELKIAPIETAVDFSFEGDVRRAFEMNHGKLPFGCHAWFNFDFEFLRPYMQKDGYELDDIVYKKYDEAVAKKKQKRTYLDVDRETMLDVLKELADEADSCKAVIFGAGKLGDECYRLLCFTGIEIVCVIDSDKERQGQCLWKHKIISPEQAMAMKQTEKAVVIAAVGQRYRDEVMAQCRTLFSAGNRSLVVYTALRNEIEKRLNA